MCFQNIRPMKWDTDDRIYLNWPIFKVGHTTKQVYEGLIDFRQIRTTPLGYKLYVPALYNFENIYEFENICVVRIQCKQVYYSVLVYISIVYWIISHIFKFNPLNRKARISGPMSMVTKPRKPGLPVQHNTNTLEPHYNAHFGLHSDMSVITEQPYNEGLIIGSIGSGSHACRVL